MSHEWPRTSLREAGVTLIDCDHRTPPAADAGYPYIAIPQLREGRLALTDVRYISPSHFTEWTRKAKPQHHDVILSRRCNPGETAYVPAGIECALGQNLVLLRADGEKLYPPFLRWLVRGPDWWDQVGMFINVGAVFDSLKCADIPNFKMRLPSVTEQKAIASVLGALDDKIELNRQMNATLEAMARALFQSWFVDFDPVRAKLDNREPFGLDAASAAMFPASFQESSLGPIPVGWSVSKVGDIASRVAMGPFGSRITRDNFVPDGVPVVRGGNLTSGFVDDDFVFLTEAKADELKASVARSLDLVFTHRGTLGQVGIIPHQSRYPRYVVSQSQMLLSVDRSKFSPWAAYLFFSSAAGEAALLANTSTTGVPAISRPTTSLKALSVVVPPLNVCSRFDEIVESLFLQREQNARQSRTLANLRDTLLPKLLSGQLAVNKLNAAEP